MDKTYYIAANWKMNGSISFMKKFCKILDTQTENKDQMIVCPPDIYLEKLKNISPDFIKIGSQDISPYTEGAYTGECSGKMLIDNQISHVIIGHSERRQYHFETNEIIKLKLLKALKNNLVPILCIGESIKEREAGQTFDVIEEQIRSVLTHALLSQNKSILIAYEPIWAIGTGLTPNLNEIEDIHLFIKHGIQSFENYKILYGGSVKSSNAADIMKLMSVDGVLIGGASLDPKELKKIMLFDY